MMLKAYRLRGRTTRASHTKSWSVRPGTGQRCIVRSKESVIVAGEKWNDSVSDGRCSRSLAIIQRGFTQLMTRQTSFFVASIASDPPLVTVEKRVEPASVTLPAAPPEFSSRAPKKVGDDGRMASRSTTENQFHQKIQRLFCPPFVAQLNRRVARQATVLPAE